MNVIYRLFCMVYGHVFKIERPAVHFIDSDGVHTYDQTTIEKRGYCVRCGSMNPEFKAFHDKETLKCAHK